MTKLSESELFESEQNAEQNVLVIQVLKQMFRKLELLFSHPKF